MSTTTSSARTNLVAGAAALIVMMVAFLVFSGTADDVDVNADAGTSLTVAETTATTLVDTSDTAAQFSDLPSITLDELPLEAIETLFLIEDGGPYPYRQDDGTFQNREGILPDRPQEHYREYTVDTPGSPDRGARRIVSGADGERYYTDDHYDSFREIVG